MENAIFINMECNITSKKWKFHLIIGGDKYYMGKIYHSEPIYNSWYECQKAAHKIYKHEMINAKRLHKLY